MSAWWLLVPMSYLLGAFPTAHLIGRIAGHNPTAEGSGNPGASNVYRVAGRRAGVSVLLGDIAKGALPAALGLALDGRALGTACGVAAMAGHVFPIGRSFRGGKGVATLGGATLVLHPLVGLALLVIWAAILRLTKVAALASLTLALLLPIGVALRGRSVWEVAAMAAASAAVVARHRSNIERLRRGREHSLRES